MAEVLKVELNRLHPHPRNEEFFSNVDGKEFDMLIESINDNGILTPIRVSEDMTIISGHQRWRAAKQLGLQEVPVIISKAIDNNTILIELIASNFGRSANNAMKQAELVKEYEALKGVRNGGDRKSDGNNFRLVTQDDIAQELGVDSRTLRNLKSLLKLDPIIQTLISDGKISATTGFKLLSKLSEEEQSKLIEMLPETITKKLSSSQVQQYIDIIRSKDDKFEEVVHEKDLEIQELNEELAYVKECANDRTEMEKEIEHLRGRVKDLEHTNSLLSSATMKRDQEDEKRLKECFNATTASIAQMKAVVVSQLQKNSTVFSQLQEDQTTMLGNMINQAISELNRLKSFVA